MIIDYDDEFTQGVQSYVGTAGVAIVGTRVKDGGAGLPRDWASGAPVVPYLRNVEACAGASGGLQVDVVAADNTGLSTNAVVLSSTTIPAASLTANSLHSLRYLRSGSPRRCLGLKFTPLGSNTTAGSAVVGFLSEGARPADLVNAF